jgi:hypothetical protein
MECYIIIFIFYIINIFGIELYYLLFLSLLPRPHLALPKRLREGVVGSEEPSQLAGELGAAKINLLPSSLSRSFSEAKWG